MPEEMVEVISHLAWDTVTLGATDLTASFFAEQLGGGSPAKTSLQTNMEDVGKFPANCAFRIHAFRIAFYPDVIAATVVKGMKGYVEFWISQKTYLESPIFFKCGGSGLFINSGDSSAGTTEYGQLGAPVQQSVYALKKPIPIEKGQNFAAKMTWGVAPTAMSILFGMDGELIRSIQ